MAQQGTQIAPGMQVQDSTRQPIGSVARVWYPDGRVVPPDTTQQGLLAIGAGERKANESGFFQLNREFAADWYIDLSAVASIEGDIVVLNQSMEALASGPVQEKPIVTPANK